MIVGADDTDDRTILHTAQSLYGDYRLRRVYYGVQPHSAQPEKRAVRRTATAARHRRADFLMRGYGFSAGRLLSGPVTLPGRRETGWALARNISRSTSTVPNRP